MSARDRIAEVLREHRPVHDPDGHINGTAPGSVATYDCWCGCVVNTTLEAVAAHLANVLVSTEGIAVVELPGPDDDGMWAVGEVSWGSTELNLCARDARAMAAALLAAAATAESGETA